MVSREILNSHPISTLKKEIGKVNIRNYSKLTKPQIVELMMKYKERFGHIKMADKKARAPRKAKPKIPQPPPAPAPKTGSAPSGNLGADIKKTARQKAQDRTVKKSKALRAATAAAKEGRARTAQRSQVSDFLGQIGGSGKSEAVKKTAGKKLELAGGKPPKKKASPAPEAGGKLTQAEMNSMTPEELFSRLPSTATSNVTARLPQQSTQQLVKRYFKVSRALERKVEDRIEPLLGKPKELVKAMEFMPDAPAGNSMGKTGKTYIVNGTKYSLKNNNSAISALYPYTKLYAQLGSEVDFSNLKARAERVLEQLREELRNKRSQVEKAIEDYVKSKGYDPKYLKYFTTDGSIHLATMEDDPNNPKQVVYRGGLNSPRFIAENFGNFANYLKAVKDGTYEEKVDQRLKPATKEKGNPEINPTKEQVREQQESLQILERFRRYAQTQRYDRAGNMRMLQDKIKSHKQKYQDIDAFQEKYPERYDALKFK
tara:strand:+ start:11546 stop:13003 length:1458 start_codon:yes stop_codon:yes gene_type:complete